MIFFFSLQILNAVVDFMFGVWWMTWEKVGLTVYKKKIQSNPNLVVLLTKNDLFICRSTFVVCSRQGAGPHQAGSVHFGAACLTRGAMDTGTRPQVTATMPRFRKDSGWYDGTRWWNMRKKRVERNWFGCGSWLVIFMRYLLAESITVLFFLYLKNLFIDLCKYRYVSYDDFFCCPWIRLQTF